MAELNPMYKALRQKSHSHPPQTAPIAAKFEDCRQSFHRLCPALKSSSFRLCSSLAEDIYGRFLAWGNDSGASTRSLDHALRKTTSLGEKTLDLLKDMYSSLQQVLEITQDEPSSSDEFEDDELRVQQNEISKPKSDPETDPEVAALIEHVDGIIGCLVRLLPNLRDPFPLDTYSSASDPTDAYPDISLAEALFPTASKSLLARLGRANWRRRIFLKILQEKRQPGTQYRGVRDVGAAKQAKRAPLREVAIDAFNFQKPSLKISTSPPRSQRPVVWRPSGSTAPSTVGESIFSASNMTTSKTYTATSVTQSEALYDKRHVVQTVPKPPIPLEHGGTFLCPYCNDEIDIGIQVISNNDWEGHVFNDLEPYMCTFDDCLRAEKTFGIRDDWFKHELESHRIVKVWLCQSCEIEFRSAQEFETHLQEQHDSICGPSQRGMMIRLCMRHSQKQQEDELCPFCSVRMRSVELKDHIANHFEQLALTSVNGDDSSEEDDQDVLGSQRFDDTMSEGRTKLEILNDFVEEQLGYILPEKRGPADKGLDRSNLDFFNDPDEEAEEGGQPALSSWKLASFLGSNPELQSGMKSSRLRVPGSDLPELQRAESTTGNLSAIRTGTHPRDDNFVGRDADLANFYKILSIPGRLCILSGTGGIGKTATALEFSFRHEQSYSCVFWVQAETQVGCADTFSLIATQLQLDEDGTIQDQKQLIELSRDFLEKTEKRWLLVFDNVEKWTDIEEYIPDSMTQSAGSVLITTRFRDLGPATMPSNFFHIDLKEMTRDESRRLLIQRMQPNLKYEKMRLHPEWKLAGDIASLAGLPLAMSQIAGYVKSSGITLAEFLELWNEWRGNNVLAVWPSQPNPSHDALETIWSIALSELGVDAHKLLKIMAFLDSEVIQHELLLNDHRPPALQFLHSSRAMRYQRLIKDLSSRKLISIKKQNGTESYSVHRLLQQRLLQDVEGAEREEIFGMAFELVRDRLPRPSLDSPDSMKWILYKEYLPHVLSLQRIFDEGLPILSPFVELSELFRDGGVHLWQRGLIYDGLRLLNSAEAILDKIDGEEDQLRADINIATALLIQYFGISHRAESRERFGRILQIRRKFEASAPPGTFTIDDELRLCNAKADYGNALLQFNNYKEAELIYQQCHDKYRQWGTEDDIPFEYAKFNHHMAFCRMYDKDFDGAIKMSEKAFELVTRGQGDHIQLILRFRFDLACIILQSGNIEMALKIQEQILKARLSLQGNGKPNYFTLQSYYAVGALYSYLGRLDEAEQYMRTALTCARERGSKGFWPDAAVARTEFHLSQILTQNGKDIAEAKSLAAKARTVLSRLLPFDPLNGVREEDGLALFDHLQPVFGGRFTGTKLLKYVL